MSFQHVRRNEIEINFQVSAIWISNIIQLRSNNVKFNMAIHLSICVTLVLYTRNSVCFNDWFYRANENMWNRRQHKYRVKSEETTVIVIKQGPITITREVKRKYLCISHFAEVWTNFNENSKFTCALFCTLIPISPKWVFRHQIVNKST